MADETAKEQNGDHEENSKYSEKAEKQIKELLGEKNLIDREKFPHALRLLDQEIEKVKISGRPSPRDHKIADVYNQRPIKVAIKVLFPIREHPKFNFVGKLLGPKGNTLKRLQDETMCKMAILGRGSMKDRDKEDELRTQGDPKHTHLSDDLHVEIVAFGPAAEAHARIAFALAEVRKYLIPDNNDDIRLEQMRQIGHVGEFGGPGPLMRGGPPRKPFNQNIGLLDRPTGPPGGGPRGGPHPYAAGPSVPMRTATREPVLHPHSLMSGHPPKSKVMSILDKARVAMKESYGYEEEYEPPYEYYPPAVQSTGGYSKPTSNYYEPSYEEPEYYSPSSGRKERSREVYGAPPSADWKVRSSSRSSEGRHRSAPYARPRN